MSGYNVTTSRLFSVNNLQNLIEMNLATLNASFRYPDKTTVTNEDILNSNDLLGGYIVIRSEMSSGTLNKNFESATDMINAMKNKMIGITNYNSFPNGSSFRCILNNDSTNYISLYSNPSQGVFVGGQVPQICPGDIVILEIIVTNQEPNTIFVCVHCPCDTCTDVIAGDVTIGSYININPPYGIYDFYYDISWTTFTGATSYSFTSTTNDPHMFVQTGPNAAILYVNWQNVGSFDVTVIGSNNCSSGSTTVTTEEPPCFLAGTKVSCIVNGEVKKKFIEDVDIDDIVVGAFGEKNKVIAAHRPKLGINNMFSINDEIDSSDHHPFVSIDKKFYTYCPGVLSYTYGREHTVYGVNGEKMRMRLEGLVPGRVQKMDIGVILQTENGGRSVEKMREYSLSPDTQLYNLVVDGSHTYMVNGYAVTGWPREDDFDYDTWCIKN